MSIKDTKINVLKICLCHLAHISEMNIIGKYLTRFITSRYATNMHPTRFSDVLLLPLKNFNLGWGNYRMHPVFIPRVSRNYPKTWKKDGMKIHEGQ